MVRLSAVAGVIHQLPGRIRLHVPVIYRQPRAGAALEERLLGLAGVLRVRSDARAGRVLVIYDPARIGRTAVVAAATQGVMPPVQAAPAAAPAPALAPVVPGAILGAVAARRLILGTGALSQARWVPAAAAGVAVVSAYPQLRRGLHCLGGGHGAAVDVVLAASGLALSTVRGSIPGLLVCWLVALTHRWGQVALARAQRAALPAAADDPEAGPEPEPEPAPGDARPAMGGIFLLAGALLALTHNPMQVLALLVAASPRARQLAASATRAHALTVAADAGIYARTYRSIEEAGQTDAAALELPLLLAEGQVEITTVTSLHDQYPVARIRSLAARLLRPLSLAVSGAVACEPDDDGRLPDGAQVEVVHGQGAILRINGERFMAGLRPLMQAHGVPTRRARLQALIHEARGEDVLYIARDWRLAGLIGVRWRPGPYAIRLTESLRYAGLLHIGTVGGDALPLHAALSQQLGLKPMAIPGGQSPHEAVRALRANGKKVLVLAADAQSGAALSAADVGVAPAGSAAAGKADVVIAGGELHRVTDLVRLGQHSRELRRQNEMIGGAVTAVSMVLALAGPLNLQTAMLLQDAVALAVLANANRTRWHPRAEHRLPPMTGGQGAAQLLPTPVLSAPAAPWHALPAAAVASHLGTCPERGLSARRAAGHLARFGPNALTQVQPPSLFQLFSRQFQNVMVLTLLGASGLSLLARAVKDALTVLGVVLMNGLFGMAQEYHTGRLVKALDRLTAPTARVIRDGELHLIAAEQLVAGDLIQVAAGDRIPADARLVAAHGLEVEESSLTGESVPVSKHDRPLAVADLGPGDRSNMLFQGTSVTRGRATAIIVATGMNTEMGRILALVKAAENGPTPLQRRLDDLGRTLLGASVALAAGVIGLGLLHGNPLMPMFMAGVGLAVAAIPEGLPAVVTIALATGVRRIARQQAVARRLSAVETLGTVAVICSDKTGTMTRNELHVRAVYAGGRDADDRFALAAAAACHDGTAGDPVDVALHRAVQGRRPGGYERVERVADIPFDPERRRVTVLLRGADGRICLVTKGAPEVVISLCTHLRANGQQIPMMAEDEVRLSAAGSKMAARALRVLAVACRELTEMPDVNELPALEAEMTFLGLIGMADPPRPEVRAAVARCTHAGVRVLMITGDHPHTAVAVGRELGIIQPGGQVLTGVELDHLSDDELRRLLPFVQICARVAPRHKLRMVRAFKQAGYIVAMTGDGVNDAPAVKEADVGIAMGSSGTEATKEASDLILTDDNFATIVKAVEEGRGIRSNIRKSLGYLLAGNAGEVLFMLLGVAAGMPLPLLPIQLLLVNLLTDALPTLVLACGQTEPEVLSGAPLGPEESLFSRGLGRQIVSRGAVTGLGTFAMYAWALRRGELGRARSMTLALLVLGQWTQVPDWQFEGDPGRFPGRRRDRWLMGSVGASAALLPGVFHVPALAGIFRTVPLSVADWLTVVASSALVGGLSRGVARIGMRATCSEN